MATINGTSGNDTLNGTSGNDTISGLDGNDTIAGKAGPDIVDGGSGNDRLYSGDASPAWTTIFYGYPYTPPLLDTGTDVDTVRGGAGDDLIFAGYSDNIDGGNGDYDDELLISFQRATAGVSFDINLGTQVIGGGTITGIEGARWVEGSNYADTIVLGTSYYTLYGDQGVALGMGGNDTLIAGYNTSSLDGGDGDDVVDGRNSQYLNLVSGGAGADILYSNPSGTGVADGGASHDTIYTYGGEAHGGDGNDTINVQNSVSSGGGSVAGDAGDDRITGSSRGENIEGNVGNDALHGAFGNDVVNGGADADVLSGDLGNDTLTGGAGNDTFLYGPADGKDTITDFAVGDVVYVDGYSSAQSITQVGTSVVVAFSVDDQITFQNADATTVEAAIEFGLATDDTQTGGPEEDFLRGFGGNDTIMGGGGNDTLAGDSGSDTLSGGAGNDLLYSAGATALNMTPTLDRGTEVDTLTGGNGDDAIYAGYGDNVDGGANGEWGRDKLYISFQGAAQGISFDAHTATWTIDGTTISGIETIAWMEGSNYGDYIDVGSDSGTGGADFSGVFGMAGDDTLIAASYTVVLDGGDGSDILDGRNSAYLMEIAGGAGNDVMYASIRVAGGGNDLNGGAGEDVLVGGTGNDTLNGGDGNDKFEFAAGGGWDTISDLTANEVVEIYEYASAQSITQVGDNVVVELSYDDQITFVLTDVAVVQSALHFVSGTQGDDTLDGDTDGDTLSGGNGNDMILGYGGNDTLSGDAGDDSLFGGAGVDNLRGGEDNDLLAGGDGNDILDGGSGVDNLRGGLGSDIYVIDGASDATVEYVGEGMDTVRSSVSHTLRVNVENLTLTGGSSIYGRGNALANIITGNDGSNKLYGLDGDDRLLGGLGSDTLDGGAGLDKMFGGAGNDIYVVDTTTDQLVEAVGEGTDTVQASVTRVLGANFERLYLTGTANISGTGNDLANLMKGNVGNNILSGRAGNDNLYGYAGADVLKGEAGNDLLEGGTGRDRFYGGTGADSYVFRDGDFSGVTSSTADQIHDFNDAEGDRIRLSLVDANSGVAGDQAFSLIGTSAFTGVAGQLRYQQISGNTFVQGDTNGDGVADFWIRLDGLHTLASDDFVF